MKDDSGTSLGDGSAAMNHACPAVTVGRAACGRRVDWVACQPGRLKFSSGLGRREREKGKQGVLALLLA